MQSAIRFFLFCVFFVVGLFGLGLSILSDELVSYYQSRQDLKAVETTNDKLRSLNEDYDVLLEQLRDDPNLLERVARITLGFGQEDSEAVYPKARPEELAAARAALTKQIEQSSEEVRLPKWLNRLKEPRRRIGLFMAGAAVILVAFIFFGPTRKNLKIQPQN